MRREPHDEPATAGVEPIAWGVSPRNEQPIPARQATSPARESGRKIADSRVLSCRPFHGLMIMLLLYLGLTPQALRYRPIRGLLTAQA